MKNGPYTLLVAPNNFPGKKYRGRYAYEHHLVWWNHSGSIVPRGYEIHHINGDHRDNRIKNLKLVTSSEHRKIHGEMLKAKHRVTIICGQCGKEHIVKGNNYRSKIKSNKYGKLFCSIKCGALHQHSIPG